MSVDLLKEVGRLEKKYISVWEDVCNIESPTTDKAGVDKVGEYFIRLANERGWQVEVFEQPVSGNVVCITMNANASLPPVTLSGHIDTVHPHGIFGYPPVKKDEVKIYGPGVIDCKGGVVAGFLAMEALQAIGFSSRPIRMLLQSDEECSSKTSNKATINYICEKAKDSVAFFNLEGRTDGAVCLARKGIVNFVFTVTGQEAHSSECATQGANAILDAAHKIIELEKFKDAQGLTCNCGVISGGTVPNTVAGKCKFNANVRYKTQKQLEWICDYIKELAQTEHVQGCRCEVEILSGRPPMERVERNVCLFEKINEIYVQNGIAPLKERDRNGGSDAAQVTIAGIPCVESMGVQGDKWHSENEFAYLASLSETAKRLAIAAYYM